MSELSCRLRGRAELKNLSFTVPTAEKVALLGRRSSGVDTLREILCGYLRPEAGRVRIGPYDLGRESSEARRLIGFVPAAPPLYPEMQLSRYLELCAELRELVEPARASREIAQRCGLTPLLPKKISSLGAGALQLINLAQGLVHDPVLVILDDPFLRLDAAERSWFMDLLRDITAYKSLVFSSQHLDLVPRLCQRMLILNEGRLAFDGPVQPQDPVAALEATFIAQTRVGEVAQ